MRLLCLVLKNLRFRCPRECEPKQRQCNAQVGGRIDINVPECGIDGHAKLLCIGPCPAIEHDPTGRRRVITGTFHHHAAEILDLRLANLTEPIGTTPAHLHHEPSFATQTAIPITTKQTRKLTTKPTMSVAVGRWNSQLLPGSNLRCSNREGSA